MTESKAKSFTNDIRLIGSAAGEGLVDYRDFSCRQSIVFIELPARNDRGSQSLKIFRTDPPEI